MKLLLILASVVFTTVLSDPDPTKVCLPEVFQSQLYSFTTDDYGTLAVDFKQEVLGIEYVKSEIRVVLNLTNFEGVGINTTDGKCQKISAAADINNVVTRCLPATAKLLTNSTRLGVAPNSVDLEAWEIDVGIGKTRVLLTTGANRIPVLRQFETDKLKEVSVYANPQLTITQKGIFDVPAVCSPATVVG